MKYVSNVIPTLQRLDIGSIQHLMTLQRYTDTLMASHYSDIHVSIPPNPDFLGTLLKVQWWWQLRWMTCLKCHPNSSKAWYRVHTTFDDPTKIYRHLSGITLQRHSCEYTPRSWFWHLFHKVQWWWQLRWMKCLHCHPNSSKTWYWVHTTFDDPTSIYRHRYDITLQWHSCEYIPPDPDFGTFTKCNDGFSWCGG